MPSSQLQVTADADRALTTDNRQVAPGRLKAITAQILATGSSSAQNLVRVLVQNRNVGQSPWRHIILQGYIGFEAGLAWTGDFPLGNDQQITVEIMSSTLATVIISLTTEDN